MNTFSRVAIALVGMTGLVAAQPKADPKAADPKAAPKAAEPKAADAKAPAMPEMKPPPELAEMAKAAAGNWRCKGQGMDHTMKMVDMTATLKLKLDLAGHWVRATFDAKMGKTSFAFESFTTFDPSSKKWKRVLVDNGGGWMTGESDGLKDNKVDWEMATHSPMMGDGKFRDHEDLSDPKTGVKMWGEAQVGDKWMKVYEMTCKK